MVTHNTVTHNTVFHNTVTHNTVTHNTVFHNTVTHNTVTHNTVFNKQKIKNKNNIIFENDETAYASLTKEVLKCLCWQKGLKVSGSKADLLLRLQATDLNIHVSHGPFINISINR